jgi:flagellar basal-body rod protein FlgB
MDVPLRRQEDNRWRDMTSIPAVTSIVRDDATTALHASLRGLTQRQKAIAENVANIETPGYQAKTVSFEDSLASAIEAGEPASFSPTESLSTAATRMNGNNVNLDIEITSQVETNMREQLVIRALNAKYAMIRRVLEVA